MKMYISSFWFCLFAVGLHYICPSTATGEGMSTEEREVDSQEETSTEKEANNKRQSREYTYSRPHTITMKSDNTAPNGIKLYIKIGGPERTDALPKLGYNSLICMEMAAGVNLTSKFEVFPVEMLEAKGNLEDLSAPDAGIEFKKIDPIFKGTKFFSCMTEDVPKVLLRMDRLFIIDRPIDETTFETFISKTYIEIDLPWQSRSAEKKKSFLNSIWSGLNHRIRSAFSKKQKYGKENSKANGGVGVAFVLHEFIPLEGGRQVYPGSAVADTRMLTVFAENVPKMSIEAKGKSLF
ncbi:uncharacterized protein LOC111061118 [Nilaparvata lugens]|uniref:uncharacterized protein LOC111061118 n=1 Tax=Nilaparvata lugens TaxID=108931 RepID=UPI00193CF59C|nr:uncharacterized protein LOC111061118 [Nilaparvata lugens]